MTGPKKSYVPPKLQKHSTASLPEDLHSVVADLLPRDRFTVIVDRERRCQSVPAGFARLLGYDTEELKGKRIDDVTVAHSVDINLVFDAFLKLGEMDGLWLFEHREGKKLLFHYRARRDREVVYAELQPLRIAS